MCHVTGIEFTDNKLEVFFMTACTGQTVVFTSNLENNKNSKLTIIAQSPDGLVDQFSIHIKGEVKGRALVINGQWEQEELTSMLVAFHNIKKEIQELVKQNSFKHEA